MDDDDTSHAIKVVMIGDSALAEEFCALMGETGSTQGHVPGATSAGMMGLFRKEAVIDTERYRVDFHILPDQWMHLSAAFTGAAAVICVYGTSNPSVGTRKEDIEHAKYFAPSSTIYLLGIVNGPNKSAEELVKLRNSFDDDVIFLETNRNTSEVTLTFRKILKEAVIQTTPFFQSVMRQFWGK
eukprot:CAMPEP_0201489470 /NCGR_PEP_ID=MMETSP0151_2-20130828/22827_1 /ASSEMBLY_ACC=CAM_ASM_000257 /TAXON_ID=200890 /ORGANISM="Paramoeba atlantica, Strain 621/1 / CCAP 1560/9" /LENGTH=183 /DNA_ID=CAMNT_0047875081 /DNA_START=162 /DNA_END=713 /DNA_ORIENTATION=-